MFENPKDASKSERFLSIYEKNYKKKKYNSSILNYKCVFLRSIIN